MSSGTAQTLTGQTIVHYLVLELVGRGGMGAVYRALDTKLKRDVAIKVLPEEFSRDRDRILRFQREAEMLASLNHPHIATIHEVHQIQDTRFLVLEYVKGETLAELIARRGIELKEALKISLEVAEALEAAHERGIIHRDLKPANIKLTPDGKVKVLDFGLARVSDRAPEGDDRTNAPTQLMVSSPGIILGTPAYMAPEQVKGEPAERAADVWAFGCVLFELIAGKQPFRGKTSPEILAEVVKTEPDWRLLPVDTPAPIRRVLQRCLRKDVQSRFHDIADVRIAIEDALDAPDTVAVRGVSQWRERTAWLIALLGVLTVGILLLRPAPAARQWRVDIATPSAAEPGGLAVSPDGTKVAYTARADNLPRLYVRSMEDGSGGPLPGTEGASLPFWSPNSTSLAFFADSRLKRIDIGTDRIQELAPASLSPAGGSWGSGGIILFSPSLRGPIQKVRDTGGELAVIDPDGRAPRFLEDGRRFLFSAFGGVYLRSLDAAEPERIIEGGILAWPGPSGYILYIRNGTLFIREFDADDAKFTGPEMPLARAVVSASDGISASVSASATGIIAFREISSADRQPRRTSWFDRSGQEIGKVATLGGLSPELSRDDSYALVSRVTADGSCVWLLDVVRGFLAPFAACGANQAQVAVYSPDGRSAAFSSSRRKSIEVFIKTPDGKERPLNETRVNTNSQTPSDWAGDFLMYRENSPETQYDLWAVDMRESPPKPFSVLKTEQGERDGQFSPDLKWIAYESNKSGRSEIYVTRFREPGPEFPVSTNGGAQVRWNPADRDELFFIALNGKLMSVQLQFSSDDQTVRALDPVPLFQTRVGNVVQGAQKQQYDVSADGQKFLISNIVDETLTPITVILNWKPSN